jgi:GTP-binding protein
LTTLEQNLGVVAVGEVNEQISFVVADIPGLIEGASEGAGLGTQFLRHIERTQMLVHLVDVSDASGRPDPIEDFEVIMNELESFGAGLEQKPMILVASKADVANPEKLAKLAKFAKKKRLPFYEISAVTGQGIKDLTWAIASEVQDLREGRMPEIVIQSVRTSKDDRLAKQVRIKKRVAASKKKSAARSSAKKTAAKKSHSRPKKEKRTS